ncbi:hypothetical protein GCM10014719_30800 [Planomonospora parontospora subsp. antibiotica]|nr:hypothetical protein GCM10014719_30800 [Planomonospora parontospora subsp. antibiotica]GII16563.1 hypothetical protein Ppa05_32890 [Planomonospora parontospora subsp. antibiotica]
MPRNAGVKGFQVLPRGRVVERTFSWLGCCRRLARDYECKIVHAEAMIKLAIIWPMAARLAGEEVEPHGPIETEDARRLRRLQSEVIARLPSTSPSTEPVVLDEFSAPHPERLVQVHEHVV